MSSSTPTAAIKPAYGEALERTIAADVIDFIGRATLGLPLFEEAVAR